MEKSETINTNTNVVADKTVREVERIDAAIQQYIKEHGGKKANFDAACQSVGVTMEVGASAIFVWNMIRRYRYTSDGEWLTIQQVQDLKKEAMNGFVHQHALNYAAHQRIFDFHDWLVEKNRIGRFSKTDSYWRKLERDYQEYQDYIVGSNDLSSRSLFADHMRLSYNNIAGLLDQMEVTVRDYLIQHRPNMIAAGQTDDIATLQRVTVCMYVIAAMQQAFIEYFLDIAKEEGIDFSIDFRYADLQKMGRNFIYMCEAQGVRFCTVNGNERKLVGIDIHQSVRVNAIWNRIIDILSDKELANETASRAIDINPKAQEKYADIFAEYDAKEEAQKRAEMEDGFKMLEEKFKVTRQS